VQDALDGALAPLRNTHKFDPVLRLPIALGVGFATAAVMRHLSQGQARCWIAAGVVALIAVTAWPMATGGLVRNRSFEGIPGYWTDVAGWLAEKSPEGRALVVPGASFGIYSWGRTQDEPLQPLAGSPWGVRDAVPLSSAGNIRWLDAIQERIDSGRGSPRLADALARAGVEYVVVRNDIDRRRSATPRTVLVRQALVRSGGFTPVVGFGPALPPFRTATTVIDDGLQDTVAAVEVWRVESPIAADDPRVTLRDASSVTVVSGAAESLVDLADAEVLAHEPVIIAGDEAALADAPGIAIRFAVTDGYRRSEVNFGSTRDNRSQTLRADDVYQLDRRVHDYFPIDPAGRQSLAVYEGGGVTASSSGSDATALRARSNAVQPWAALDGDPTTAWVSGALEKGVGQWWEVVADEEFRAPFVSVRLVLGELAGIEPARVTVSTDAGEITVPVVATGESQRLPLPAGPTRTLRLTLDAVVDGGVGEAFGLREVVVPGLRIERRVATAGQVDGGPIVLTARKGEQTGCAAVTGQLVCSPQLGRPGEERTGIARIVDIASPGDYRLRVWVRPRAGAALDQLLAPALPDSPRAKASGVYTIDPASRPQAAIDGVLATSWVASPLEARPELSITWGEPRRIRGVRIDLAPDLVASRPLRVTATVNGRETTDIVTARGTVTVPAQEATSLRLRFDNADVVRSLDPTTGAFTALPIGINEIRILGAEDLRKGPRLFDDAGLPCGFGPEVSIDGQLRAEMSVTASVIQTLTDELVQATPCDGRIVSLGAGKHVVEAASTAEYAVEMVSFEPLAPLPRARTGAATVEEWEATNRAVSVDVAAAPRILETSENFNDGWRATLEGTSLQAVRVDGWRQGWIVPAGAGGTVTLAFTPQRLYSAGLVVGLLCAAGLLALALVRRRSDLVIGPDPDVPVRGRGWLLTGAALVAGLLIGGWIGLCAASVGVLLAVAGSRAAVAGALAGAAAVGAAVSPWPSRLDAPDWLLAGTALTVLAALAAAAAPLRSSSDDAPTQGLDAPRETRTH